ncbi:glycosyltransferase [Candidatus Nitrospira neomarina]|uniref:Glycosyltransferase n=1 Tax=Candidatus Nitrospira neomarina TaxID=3020899 RepID=A0AA96GFV3_9BACT|nr:glycosyltransferase [Candidatus Nitrospira neomarina]WNM60287.1 glycosyltransferase [Candidatus Nitrospira neomarina]
MKVAFIVSQFPSATETFVQSQIVGMIEAGLEVNIFAGKARDDLPNSENLKKYMLRERTRYQVVPKNKVRRFAKGLYLILKYILKYPVPIVRSLNVFQYGRAASSLTLLYKIIPFLGTGPYDIIHCQFGTDGLQGLYIKQVAAPTAKVVTSFRGFDASKMIYECPDLYKTLFREGDLFLPVSHSLKNLIVQQGCDERKIVVLASGIKCQNLAWSPKNVLQDEPIHVITIARLIEKKGIPYAIEAVDKIVKSGKSIRYSIIGEGELRGDLEQLIQERDLKEHVRLLGWKSHEEVIRLLQDAHILIAPSVTAKDGDQEGIPNAIKEAMAMGLPVIATQHSGIPELVEDGVSGYLVRERDADALADRLSYLVDHPEKWPDMGRAGRARVETDYDMKTLNDRLVELYGQVCAKT